jgi:hypothetical protein
MTACKRIEGALKEKKALEFSPAEKPGAGFIETGR